MTNSVAIGGMEEHVRLLAQEIDRAEYRVYCVTPDWPATNEFSRRLAEVADQSSHCTPDARYGRRRQFTEAVALAKLARRERFTVAHLHSTTYRGFSVATIALRLAGVRTIVLTEHLAPDHRFGLRRRTTRWIATRQLSTLIAVSATNRDARLANLGRAACPTLVVNNGIDVSRFDVDAVGPSARRVGDELGFDDDAVVIGTAIRLEQDKGVDDLIDAFASVNSDRPNTRLLIAGDGSQRTQLEQRVERLGISACTRFVGFQSDPIAYIRAMDVFVLPVPFGSASIGLLEAMAIERACIITFGDGREAVIHGVSGLCARPNDPQSLAHEIRLLVDDADLRSRLGSNARARVVADYSSTRVARELESIYASTSVAT